MSCSICFEEFSAGEHRPKSLPCGHSYCLPCLRRLQTKECPKDRKAFEGSIDKLPDNFMLIELCEGAATAAPSYSPTSLSSPPRSWCSDCEAVASEQCAAQRHALCSLRKARAERVAPLVADLQTGEAALRGLRRDLELDDGEAERARGHLEDALDSLDGLRRQLHAAMAADEAVFGEASEAARLDGLARAAVSLHSALEDPVTELSLCVEAADGVWTAGSLKPQQRPAARLLLSQLLCDGQLHREDGQSDEKPNVVEEAVDADAPRWRERTNEQALDGKAMASRMAAGVRVVRGEHWYRAADGSADGVPPGRGTVTACDTADGRRAVDVEWDCGGRGSYSMDLRGERHPNFHLRLVPSWPRTVFTAAEPDKEHPGYLDAIKISSSLDSMAKGDLLTKGTLKKVSVLQVRCDVSPPWAKLVLQAAADQLQILSLVRPTADHLRVARRMPRLKMLLLSGADSETMRLALALPGLTHLEAHCPFEAPLGATPLSSRPPLLRWLVPEDARLRQWLRAAQESTPKWLRLPQPCSKLAWLCLGVYPLRAALDVVRAHAATLEVLALVAASREPYGCPDLAAELRRCGLRKLRQLALLRESDNYFCRHDAASCKEQKLRVWNMFTECGLTTAVWCSECEKKDQVS